MSMQGRDAEKWNSLYRNGEHTSPAPATVLELFTHLLPARGKALDLACGRGANAIYLASHGLDTSAWDISDEAIKWLEHSANSHNLKIDLQVRDVIKQPPESSSFDVIVVGRFLDRSLFPALCKALTVNGLLFYQTFIRERVSDTGPSNPGYRLAENELLELSSPLHIIYYHEEGTVGNTSVGFRDQAMLIAQRRQ